MDWTAWFRYQLQATADGFAWALKTIEPDCHFRLPPEPGYLGTWPPARHVWHVTEYERCLALPSMNQWLGGQMPPGDDWHDDDKTWEPVAHLSAEQLLAEFRAVRTEELAHLEQLADVDWSERRETLWGRRPLSMIVTKTFQHTYEHGDTLLRMGLWWKTMEGRE
jgi:hypothetical protein